MLPITLRSRRRLLTATSCCLLLAVLLLLILLLQHSQLRTNLLPMPPPPPRVPRGPHRKPHHRQFEYVLRAPVCGDRSGIKEPVRAVVVVHSDPRRPEVRRAIRDSLPAEELAKLGVRRAFMVAMASTSLFAGERTIPQVRIGDGIGG